MREVGGEVEDGGGDGGGGWLGEGGGGGGGGGGFLFGCVLEWVAGEVWLFGICVG